MPALTHTKMLLRKPSSLPKLLAPHLPNKESSRFAKAITATSSSSGSSSSRSKCSAFKHSAEASCATTSRSSSEVSTSSSGREASVEMCVIVDEQNRVVGAATRYDTVSKRLLGRGAYVLVFDGVGRLFVSKRSNNKDCYPGCLDVTISGVVNQGEEYEQTAARELEEEIGIPLQHSHSHLQQLFIFPYQDDVCHVWGCAFSVVWGGEVQFQDAEVEWGRFMEVRELQQQLEKHPESFTPVGKHILGLYFDRQQQQKKQQQQKQLEIS